MSSWNRRGALVVSLVSLATLVCDSPSARAVRAQEAFVRGDILQDGTVSVADAHAVSSWLFLEEPVDDCLAASDVNRDGMINLTDAVYLLNARFLGGSGICEPWPEPGTVEDVPCASYEPRERVEDLDSVLEIGDATVGADGRVQLLVRLTSSFAVRGLEVLFSIPGVLADGQMVDAMDLTGLSSGGFRGGNVFDDEARVGYLASFHLEIEIPPDEAAPIVEISACVAEGAPAGEHEIVVIDAEIVGSDGRVIVPTARGGTLSVPAGVAGCEARPGGWSEASACAPSDPIDPPDPPDPPAPPEPVVEQDFSRGDTNLDGQVSISDALLLRRFLFNGERPPRCRDGADLNDDSTINITDAIYLLNATLLGGPRPEAPFPGPGPDPTPGDGMSCEDVTITPPETTSDTVDLGEVEAVPGSTVDVPVYLSNAREVEAFQLVVSYDPAIFTPLVLITDGGHYDGADLASFEAVSVSPVDGYFLVGFIPHIAHETFAVPPGEDRLVFFVRGEVSPDAPVGMTIPLLLADGPDGTGVGTYSLRNEITYRGTASFLSALPEGEPGELKIVGDITIFRGDANDDDRIDISDPVTVLNRLFFSAAPLPCPDAADANDDGALDISDATTILNTLFLGAASIAPPYPEHGIDPTPDALGACARR